LGFLLPFFSTGGIRSISFSTTPPHPIFATSSCRLPLRHSHPPFSETESFLPWTTGFLSCLSPPLEVTELVRHAAHLTPSRIGLSIESPHHLAPVRVPAQRPLSSVLLIRPIEFIPLISVNISSPTAHPQLTFSPPPSYRALTNFFFRLWTKLATTTHPHSCICRGFRCLVSLSSVETNFEVGQSFPNTSPS